MSTALRSPRRRAGACSSSARSYEAPCADLDAPFVAAPRARGVTSRTRRGEGRTSSICAAILAVFATVVGAAGPASAQSAPQSLPQDEVARQVASLRDRIRDRGPAITHAIRALGRFGADAASAVPELHALVEDDGTDPYARSFAVCALLQIGDDLDGLERVRGLERPVRTEAVFGVVQYAIDTAGSLMGAVASPDELVGLVCEELAAVPDDYPRAPELANASAWMANDALSPELVGSLEEALVGLADRAPQVAAIAVRSFEGLHPATGDPLPDDASRVAAFRLRSEPATLLPGDAGVAVLGWTEQPELRWIPGSTAERTFVARGATSGEYGARVTCSGTARPVVAVREDGRIVAGGGLDAAGLPTVQVIDLAAGRVDLELPLPGRIATVSALHAVADDLVVARFRELYRYDLTAPAPAPIRIANDYVGQGTAVRILPGGRFVVPGADHALEVRALADGALLERLEGHLTTVLCLELRGGRLASGDRGGDVIVWDVASLSPLQRVETCSSGVGAIDLSPDGARLAVGTKTTFRPQGDPPPACEGAVFVHDARTGARLAAFATFPDNITAVRFGEDGLVHALSTARFAYTWRIGE